MVASPPGSVPTNAPFAAGGATPATQIIVAAPTTVAKTGLEWFFRPALSPFKIISTYINT